MKLGATSKDTDGRLITNGEEYRVYILSVGSGNSKEMYSLSYPSSYIALEDLSASGSVEKVTLSILNKGYKYNDINISFDVKNSQSVTEYRVFMLPKDKADSFKLEDAIKSTHSTRIFPNSLPNVSQALSTPLDAFGNQLDSSTEYVAKVLILAKGTYSLSNISNNSVQLQKSPDNINNEASQDPQIN